LGGRCGHLGVDSFDNDAAVDWTFGLDKSDLTYIEAALDRILGIGADYLDATDAQEAIAAAEAVARLQGKFGVRNAYTQNIDEWVARLGAKPSPQLAQKARDVLMRIQQQPSGLLDAWSESPNAERWKQSVSALALRIGS
jgi:hypothetical protein